MKIPNIKDTKNTDLTNHSFYWTPTSHGKSTSYFPARGGHPPHPHLRSSFDFQIVFKIIYFRYNLTLFQSHLDLQVCNELKSLNRLDCHITLVIHASLSIQHTNRLLVSATFKPQISYLTARDFTYWANYNPQVSTHVLLKSKGKSWIL